MVNDTMEVVGRKIRASYTKSEQHRVTAGTLAAEARARFDAGERDGFKSWNLWWEARTGLSKTTGKLLLQIGRASDPAAEVERQRELSRSRVEGHREKIRSLRNDPELVDLGTEDHPSIEIEPVSSAVPLPVAEIRGLTPQQQMQNMAAQIKYLGERLDRERAKVTEYSDYIRDLENSDAIVKEVRQLRHEVGWYERREFQQKARPIVAGEDCGLLWPEKYNYPAMERAIEAECARPKPRKTVLDKVRRHEREAGTFERELRGVSKETAQAMWNFWISLTFGYGENRPTTTQCADTGNCFTAMATLSQDPVAMVMWNHWHSFLGGDVAEQLRGVSLTETWEKHEKTREAPPALEEVAA